MKKWLAFLLCLCLTVPILPAHAEDPFDPDLILDWDPPTVADAPVWAVPAYEALTDRAGLSLEFSGAITRGRFTVLLTQLLRCAFRWEELEVYPPMPDGYFADVGVNSDFYCDFYLEAAGYGIVEGTVGADGLRRIDPDSKLTREQCAKMVCSLLDFVSQKLGCPLDPSGSPTVYADAASISAWALPFTQRIAAYGLMKGDNFGNFTPQGELDWPSAVVLANRTLELMDAAAIQNSTALLLQGQTDWQFDSGRHYTIDNGDGTVSTLVAKDDVITVERFAADGSLVSSKTLEWELRTFGAFLDSGSHFYLAFGQSNGGEEDGREVWRIVQYDRDWNRLGAASVNGGDSYTTEPFWFAAAQMAVSADGKTLALHAARQRYLTPDDGLRHQSNITITVNTADMKVLSVSEPFPSNHVSHSFGQFVRFDGEEMVTVDLGDAYPRAFVLHDDAQEAVLFKIAGDIGDNTTHAAGCGLEISEDGYLFLGCSTPQKDFSAEADAPRNLFLTYTTKEPKEPTPPWPKGSTETSLTVLPGGSQYKASWKDPDGRTSHWGTFNIGEDLSTTTFTWLTHSDTSIGGARLVKLNDNSFVAMWQEKDGEDIHYQRLDGKGQLVGQEQVLADTLMPPAAPVVMDGDICWVHRSSLTQHKYKPALYRIDL